MMEIINSILFLNSDQYKLIMFILVVMTVLPIPLILWLKRRKKDIRWIFLFILIDSTLGIFITVLLSFTSQIGDSFNALFLLYSSLIVFSIPAYITAEKQSEKLNTLHSTIINYLTLIRQEYKEQRILIKSDELQIREYEFFNILKNSDILYELDPSTLSRLLEILLVIDVTKGQIDRFSEKYHEEKIELIDNRLEKSIKKITEYIDNYK